MSARIRFAKLSYCLAGWLAPLKTPQRMYELTGVNGEKPRYVGRMWMPCVTSMRLIELSVDLDPGHWDHWALEHVPGDVCLDAVECHECGGHIHSICVINLNEEVVSDADS